MFLKFFWVVSLLSVDLLPNYITTIRTKAAELVKRLHTGSLKSRQVFPLTDGGYVIHSIFKHEDGSGTLIKDYYDDADKFECQFVYKYNFKANKKIIDGMRINKGFPHSWSHLSPYAYDYNAQGKLLFVGPGYGRYDKNGILGPDYVSEYKSILV